MTLPPTLLMLGAGPDQLAAYRHAQGLGYRLVAVDQRADAPGAALAGRFLPISTRDADEIADALNGDRPVGIVTTATDAALGTHRQLALHYGLPYAPAQRAVRASMDKTFFRKVLAERGLNTYGWISDTDPERVAKLAKDLPLPVVVKPTDGSGGKGITLVTAWNDLDGAIQSALALSQSGTVLVEEYVVGRHYAVEIWMRDGEAHFVSLTEKLMTPPPAMLTTGHLIPASLSAAVTARVEDTLVGLCRTLDIVDGPANFDFVLTESEELYMIEVGARLGGNAYPQLMYEAWGVDTVAATVSLSVGEPFALVPSRTRVCLVHLLTSHLSTPAIVREINGLHDVAGHAGVLSLEMHVGVGQVARPYTEAGYKLGYVVLVADDHQVLDALLAWVDETLSLELEPIDV